MNFPSQDIGLSQTRFLTTVYLLSALMTCFSLSSCHKTSQINPISKINSQPVKNPWYQSGQATLQQHLQIKPIKTPAKNVIIFIADGHGITSNTALRIFSGQHLGLPGEEHVLSYETFPHLALAKTYNTDSQVPDSAGTATAILTGIKTRIGLLAVTEEVARGDCPIAAHQRIPTLIELAEQQGLATGIVTTTRLTHATPAAAYAHSSERNYEDDSSFTQAQIAADCQDIAAQFTAFDHGDGIDIVLGGGRRHFLPEHRQDQRHLIHEWQDRFPNGRYIETLAAFNQLPQTYSAQQWPILGLLSDSHMMFEADRTRTAPSEPSLAEMTAKALHLLINKTNNSVINKTNNSDQGFVLLVEAGRIDHAHHANNAYRALEDGRAYAAAVATAISMTNEQDTLIIATADHSHALTMAGYPGRGNPILGLVSRPSTSGPAKNSSQTNMLSLDGNPFTTLSYANGPSAQQPPSPDPSSLTNATTTELHYQQAALVPLNSETHGGEDVAIYARGPGAWLLDGTIEQHYIFHVIQHALRW